MRRVSRFRCVIASSRLRTLILRYGLVGRRAPGCGAVLHSSGACPCVGIALKRSCPEILFSHRVGGSGSHCFNPCADTSTIGDSVSLVGGVCGLHAYGHELPHSVKTSQPYLGCRVRRYDTPYRKCIAGRRCTVSMGNTVSFLGNSCRRAVGTLDSGVLGTSRDVRFRGTTRCESLVGDIGRMTRGRGVAGTSNRSGSVVTLTGSSASTIIRMFFVEGKGLVNESRFRIEIKDRRTTSSILGGFIGRFCSKAPFVPHRIVLRDRVRSVTILRR